MISLGLVSVTGSVTGCEMKTEQHCADNSGPSVCHCTIVIIVIIKVNLE